MIIATAYSGTIDSVALLIGVLVLGGVVVRRRGVRSGPVYLLLGVAAWIAFFKSGVDPLVVGLVLGLPALAYPATRSDLKQAWESFRQFREQPPRIWPAACGRACRWRCRRTTGCSSCSTPGPAT